MDVQTDLVTQAVHHEQGVRAQLHGLLHVAFHQTQVFESLGDDFAGETVQFFVVHTRVRRVDGIQVGFQHDFVDFLLFLGELAVHGQRARVVGAVVHQSLCASVHQQHVAGLQDAVVLVVVERFAMLRQNHGEGDAVAVRQGDALCQAGQFALGLTLHAATHHGGVHLHADLAGLVHLVDFALLFRGTEVHDAHNQIQRSGLADVVDVHACEVSHQDLVVAAILRGEVHLAALRLRLLDEFGELCERTSLRHAHFLGQRGNRRLVAHPNDVVDGEVVAEDNRLVRVEVNDGGDVGDGKSEEIEEVTVLTEVIGIVGIVHRGLMIAQKHGDTVLDGRCQFRSSVLINLGFE